MQHLYSTDPRLCATRNVDSHTTKRQWQAQLGHSRTGAGGRGALTAPARSRRSPRCCRGARAPRPPSPAPHLPLVRMRRPPGRWRPRWRRPHRAAPRLGQTAVQRGVAVGRARGGHGTSSKAQLMAAPALHQATQPPAPCKPTLASWNRRRRAAASTAGCEPASSSSAFCTRCGHECVRGGAGRQAGRTKGLLQYAQSWSTVRPPAHRALSNPSLSHPTAPAPPPRTRGACWPLWAHPPPAAPPRTAGSCWRSAGSACQAGERRQREVGMRQLLRPLAAD